ncbi:zinc-dependent alcohol dehydrogenase family protein [Vibrio superstes]|uniref:Quinone oxidoreductase n=1 Tax=Vibrio superstes NBRC 103154 TaxID=1219062 RepID=A0A511QNL5_9VIBR|nr:zinc-dependent alcohol dehydrogenase family protein [Vibrio superstes]GEM78923.1 quinone oxidoreductase [Vibrio superstes NBRC 103154]
MKATIVREYGGVDAFEVADVAKPEIKAGEVLVRVAATSVNTVDMMIREMGEGLPFSPKTPAILGMDFAGTIEAVGSDVSGFAVGDEVYGCAGGLGDLQGTLAEYMPADAKLIAHKPKNLSMRESAAIPLAGITAYEGLVRANTASGQKVLVHGGSGGVGHLALQIAKHMGADVYATGRAGEQATLMEKLGATAIDFTSESVEDYVAKHTQGAGFEVVYDSVGGENLLNSMNAAALNGHIATTVSLLELDLSTAHFKGLSLHVVFMLIPMIHNFKREEHGQILAEIAKIAEAGALIPVVDPNTFDLSQAGDAHAHLASGKAIGKVVIDVA